MTQTLQAAVEVWFKSIGTAPDYKTMHYWEGAGQSEFDINFSGGYISQGHVKAFIRNDSTGISTPVAITFLTNSRVSVSSPVPVGYTICIYRDTPKNAPLALFIDGAIMNAVNFDRNAKQSVFAVAELIDRFDVTNALSEEAIIRASAAKLAAEEAAADAAAAEAQVATAQGAAAAAEASAQSAAALAGTANTNASNALAVATGIDAKATQALANSNQAVATAQDAEAIANAIDGKATTAQSQSAAAIATANTALTTANAVEGKADRALQAVKPVLAVEWVPKRDAMWVGHVPADGQLLNREDYPDAWDAIAAGSVPVVSDSTWLSDHASRGCYTTGNGSTTFRVPDYNGAVSDSYGPVYLGGGSVVGGTILRDRIQNITASGLYGGGGRGLFAEDVAKLAGAFKKTRLPDGVVTQSTANNFERYEIGFDASLVARTGDTTHPITAVGCWAIRLFGVVQNPGSIDAATLATAIAGVASRVSTVEAKVASLEQRKSTCLVNATGTGAPHETVVTQLPAKVGPSSGRLVLPNPFGNNTPVKVEVQAFLNNKWGTTGFIFSGSGLGIYGGWVQGEGIIVQSGAYTASDSTTTGGTHGFTGGNITTPLPVRVFVKRADD